MSNHKNKQEGNFASRRLILLQDTALSVVATVIAILLVRWLSEPIPNFTALIFHWLGISLIASVLGFFAARSMKTISRYTTARNTVRLVSATLIKEAVFVLCLLLGWLSLPSPVYATMALLADFVLTMGLLLGARFMAIEFARENARVTENAGKGTVLVYGTGPESVALADRTDREGRYIVVGFFTRDRSQSGLVIGNRVVYYCATSEDLDRLQWRLGGVDGLLFPKGMTLSEMQDGSENTDLASEIPQADGMTRAGHIVKRTFDILLSGILLIIFSPLIGLCALAVKLEDGSPVIYKQERIGFGGKPFNILKFRSMRTDAEAGGKPALYSGDDDPRLTKVGKFLRQHHLDELPQLWNVFRGDMSFIGYRPERQFYINQIMERNPRYRYLYQIRPGVTSYATLYNGYTDTLEKMLTRLDLDLYYLRNHSVFFDIKVLGLTFLNIVAGKKF
jgi:Sugar transferases involved in lipopolysaccharide synthesis